MILKYLDAAIYIAWDISTRFSNNSEAFASEFYKNLSLVYFRPSKDGEKGPSFCDDTKEFHFDDIKVSLLQ